MTQDLTNTSSNIMDSFEVSACADQALLAYEGYSLSRKALDKSLMDWLKSRVSSGMVIDVSREAAISGRIPQYLSGCTVIRGNARKARKFKIVEITGTGIDRHMSFFSSSQWTCSAIPINEDGKEMSGRVAKSLSYGADSNKYPVTLRFNFFREKF